MFILSCKIAGIVFLVGAIISFFVAALIKGLFIVIRFIGQLGENKENNSRSHTIKLKESSKAA